MNSDAPTVVFDARWIGPHGIGRFASEVHARLGLPIVDVVGRHPVSALGLAELGVKARLAARGHRDSVFFSPGYCPPTPAMPRSAFVVHDLIHLDISAEHSRFKQVYYERVVRPAIRSGVATMTVSEFSRNRIAEWAGIEASTITVVGNGVDEAFRPEGRRHAPGFPYVLSVGNTKPHKNLPVLLAALRGVPDVHLVLSGRPDAELVGRASALGVAERLHFAGFIPEEDLPAYYRGAEAVAVPSLYEGFGLAALEGLACGVPVIASDATALPEVVGEAGILVDPHDADALAHALTTALTDDGVRAKAAVEGPRRAAGFRWDEVAGRVRRVLLGSVSAPRGR